jgi:hypothetical protein
MAKKDEDRRNAMIDRLCDVLEKVIAAKGRDATTSRYSEVARLYARDAQTRDADIGADFERAAGRYHRQGYDVHKGIEPEADKTRRVVDRQTTTKSASEDFEDKAREARNLALGRRK